MESEGWIEMGRDQARSPGRMSNHDESEFQNMGQLLKMPMVTVSLNTKAYREACMRIGHDPTVKLHRVNPNDVAPISDNLDTLVSYWLMRLRGESHAMAEMLATRSFPSVRTDSTFNAGTENGRQFEKCPAMGSHYKKMAEDAGVSTTGKTYKSGLASFPGDPTAWVSDRHDVMRICEEKGFKCSGDVEYDPGEREPRPDVELADDIVQREVNEIMQEDHGYRRADVEEKVYNFRSGKDRPYEPVDE